MGMASAADMDGIGSKGEWLGDDRQRIGWSGVASLPSACPVLWQSLRSRRTGRTSQEKKKGGWSCGQCGQCADSKSKSTVRMFDPYFYGVFERFNRLADSADSKSPTFSQKKKKKRAENREWAILLSALSALSANSSLTLVFTGFYVRTVDFDLLSAYCPQLHPHYPFSFPGAGGAAPCKARRSKDA